MNKKSIILGLAGLLALACPVPAAAARTAEKPVADLLIVGNIYTAEREQPSAEAVAVRDGKILYVGRRREAQGYAGKGTKVIRTGKGLAMPGFIDAHAHGAPGGMERLTMADLRECGSYEEYIRTVRDYAAQHNAPAVVQGTGWDDGFLPDGRDWAKDLDQACADRPVVLTAASEHSYLVNSKALALMGVTKDTPDVPGGVISRDAAGNPTGCFREAAKRLVEAILPVPTVAEQKAAILAYQEEALSYGITGYFEPMAYDGDTTLLQAYNELDAEGRLAIHCWGGWQIRPSDDPEQAAQKAAAAKQSATGKNFRLTGVKIFLDGVLEGHTAWLERPYDDAPQDCGKPQYTQEALNRLVLAIDRAGLSVHAHSIGDAATEELLNALQSAAATTGSLNRRHAVTHLQLVRPADIKRMARLNVTAVLNPYWACGGPDDGRMEAMIGKERTGRLFPVKSFLDAGIHVTVASDYPCTRPADPLQAIQTGATRRAPDDDPATELNPAEAAAVEQLMRGATCNGAWQNFAEGYTGSLKAGKQADIILLDRDIRRIPPREIHRAKVLKTICGGKLLYESRS